MYKDELGSNRVEQLNDKSLSSYPPTFLSSRPAPIPTFPHKGRRCAFTLAEVLITLGIIGVVAALTLPTLVQNYKKQEVASRLKKFYSTMSQAVKLSEIDNGEVNNWKKDGMIYNEDGTYEIIENGKVTKEFFLKYLAPYMKYNKITDAEIFVDQDGNKTVKNTTVYLSDGSSISLYNGVCMDLIFDINGQQNPNMEGRDKFRFLICPDSFDIYLKCGKNYGSKQNFCPYLYRYYTREQMREQCKNQAAYCSGLLYMDNWEFLDDYPYKL